MKCLKKIRAYLIFSILFFNPGSPLLVANTDVSTEETLSSLRSFKDFLSSFISNLHHQKIKFVYQWILKKKNGIPTTQKDNIRAKKICRDWGITTAILLSLVGVSFWGVNNYLGCNKNTNSIDIKCHLLTSPTEKEFKEVIISGDLQKVELLLENVTNKEEFLNSAFPNFLHYSLMVGSDDMIKSLIDKGARVDEISIGLALSEHSPKGQQRFIKNILPILIDKFIHMTRIPR